MRKDLEKEHGYGWLPPMILALLGVTLAFDVTKEVEKHEQRHKEEEDEEEKRRRRRRERDLRSGSRRHRRRDSEDEEGFDDDDDDQDDYDSRDRRRRRRRRTRSNRRGEQQQQKRWSVPDDIDIRNDYEGLGGGREAGMERAESLERGEVVDHDNLDGGLDRADQLEKGEAGVPDDRDRYDGRPRRSIAYDEFDDGRQYRRRRYEEPDYEYLDYSRGRRALDERRSRPRPRRRSSDW